MSRSSLHQKKSQSRTGVILSILVVAVITFMTVGFASYGQILNFSGTVGLQPQGDVRITNVQ